MARSCSAARAISPALRPVHDVKIKAESGGGKAGAARSYNARTDTSGHFEIDVKKGKYKVSANAGLFKTSPGEERVNLKNKSKARADFKACGFKDSASASASASAATNVRPGDWWGDKGTAKCYSRVEMTWNDSATRGQSLFINKWIVTRKCEDPQNAQGIINFYYDKRNI